MSLHVFSGLSNGVCHGNFSLAQAIFLTDRDLDVSHLSRVLQDDVDCGFFTLSEFNIEIDQLIGTLGQKRCKPLANCVIQTIDSFLILDQLATEHADTLDSLILKFDSSERMASSEA